MNRWPGPFPVFVAEAQGARVTDVDGLDYIDLCLGDTGAFNDLEALERELATGDVAGVLAEPALTNIGIVLPDPGFHTELRRHPAMVGRRRPPSTTSSTP